MSKFDKSDLDNHLDLSTYFKERSERATIRLVDMPRNHLFFGVIGLNTKVEHFTFGTVAKLQKVVEPPGEIELAAALSESNLMSLVARYSHGIEYEIDFDMNEFDEQTTLDACWWLVSAIRVKSLAEFLIPVVSNYSWSTIAAVKDRTCGVNVIEDIPGARRFGSPKEVDDEDLKWVDENITKFVKLLNSQKFRLAVEALTSYNFQSNERMMAATLWAGVEALFNIQSELRFRLSILISSFLEDRGESRYDLYKKLKKLYDIRSKAVHGSQISNNDLTQHILEVRYILSQLLCKMTEIEKVPTEEELENFIFC